MERNDDLTTLLQAAIEYNEFTVYITPFVMDTSAKNIFAGNYGQSVKPPFYNLNINRMCRAKAQDMDTCIGDSEQDMCNGTLFNEVITWWMKEPADYYTVTSDGMTGTGITRAFHAISSFLCFGAWTQEAGGQDKPGLGRCSEDSPMNGRYAISSMALQVGAGVSGVGTANHSAFQDCSYSMSFANMRTSVYTSNRIASGAHMPNPFNPSQFWFKVNYASNQPPKKALLIYGGYEVNLIQEYAGSQGIVYTTNVTDKVPDECVPYAFWFEYDDVVERYPEEGSFLTYGLGSCTEDYHEPECTEGDCCDVRLQLFYGTTTQCNDGMRCTKASFCTGNSNTCPKPTLKAKGELCGDPNAVCQLQGKCDGISETCPAVYKPNTSICQQSTTDCVDDFYCTGTSNECKEIQSFRPGGYPCSVGKCSGFDTTCSRKIGSVTVKFTMGSTLTSQELADGIVNAVLAGRKEGLLRIEKTDVSNGISVIVELESTRVAQALYEGLKNTGKLGDYGGVTDVSISDMFEPVSLTSACGRAELSVFLKAFGGLIVLFSLCTKHHH